MHTWDDSDEITLSELTPEYNGIRRTEPYSAGYAHRMIRSNLKTGPLWEKPFLFIGA